MAKDERYRRLLAENEQLRKHWHAALDAEHAWSDAYTRLRKLIPGALDVDHGAAPEQVWQLTEDRLKALRVAAKLPPEGYVRLAADLPHPAS